MNGTALEQVGCFFGVLSKCLRSTGLSISCSKMLPAVGIRCWDDWASAFSTEVAMLRSPEVSVALNVDAYVGLKVAVQAYSDCQQRGCPILVGAEVVEDRWKAVVIKCRLTYHTFAQIYPALFPWAGTMSHTAKYA